MADEAPGVDVDALLERLRVRAADPDRRVELGPGRFSLRGLFAALRGRALGRATAAEVRAAEVALGVVLPPFLVRVYTEVADGGFGPRDGLLPLARVIAETHRLRAGDELPRRRKWPATLLPLVALDPGWTCVDVASGAIVDWDPEDLTEWASAERFRDSFSERAASLEAWLSRWVSRKTAADRNKPPRAERWRRLEARGRSPASRAIQARKSIALLRTMSPAERAALGLPDEGWEQVVLDSFVESGDPPR